MDMILPITSILAGFIAIMLLWLSMQVGMRRIQLGADVYDKTTDGDGDDLLRLRLNALNNFTESAPIGLLLIAFIEVSGASTLQIGLLALTFLICRLMHAGGTLWQKSSQLRTLAMFIQYVFLVVTGVWLIYSHVFLVNITA